LCEEIYSKLLRKEETAEYAEFVFEYIMREEHLRSQRTDYNFEILH